MSHEKFLKDDPIRKVPSHPEDPWPGLAVRDAALLKLAREYPRAIAGSIAIGVSNLPYHQAVDCGDYAVVAALLQRPDLMRFGARKLQVDKKH